MTSDISNELFKEIPPGFIISKDKSHLIFEKEIEKSSNDNRSYRIIRLRNEIEVLIVHDEKSEKAAATLNVHVGSFSDPEDLLGLAHYCKHLLFTGTKKYPNENEYSEFLSKHNGWSNAHTADDYSIYYFEVGHEYLEPALDRFAQFFINPLFDPDCTDRELKAIDSKFKGHLQEDHWRLDQLLRLNSNPNHPWSRFSVGNLETLKELPTKEGIDTREVLIKWYEKHYSANLMKLSILGSDSLDKLTEWVVEKFSDILNKNVTRFKSVEIPLRKGVELPKQILAKPVRDVHSLTVYIPIPNQRENYREDAVYYAINLIGHRGVGSIYSLLKKKGWINSIYAKPIEIGFDFFTMMMGISLTKDGLGHYEDVLEIIFQYIELIRREGPQEWIFNESLLLHGILHWRFLEKSQGSQGSSYTNSISRGLREPYPRDKILSAKYTDYEYDPKLIIELLDCLRIENCIVIVASKLLSDFDKKDEWFSAEYKCGPISENLIKKLKNPVIHPDLKLPVPNKYIPTNLVVNKLENVTPKTRPDIISDNEFHRVWYKKDDTWWMPKVKIGFGFKTPLIRNTVFNWIKTEMYYNLFVDSFVEKAYDASLAGLSFAVYANANEYTIHVRVLGYNDKASFLLESILKEMKDFVISPERFKVIKDRIKGYYDKKLRTPKLLASQYRAQLFREDCYSAEECLTALEEVEMEDVQSFIPEIFKRFFIEAYIFGNIEKDEVMKMVKMVENLFKPKMLEKCRLRKYRNVILPEGKRYVYQRDVYNKDELNSVIEYYLQCGDKMDKHARSRLRIVSQILKESVFNNLRTKEQLGYSGYSHMNDRSGDIGLSINLQSERNPVYLESRVEALLIQAQTIIEEMSEEEYQKQKTSLIDRLLEKEKDIWSEVYKYFFHIYGEYYDFYENIEDSEAIKTITKDDVLKFYKIYINPKSPKIKKLSVHVKSLKCVDNNKSKDSSTSAPTPIDSELEEGGYKLSEDNIIITDMFDFKNRMCLGPAAAPVVPISTFYVEEMLN